MEYATQGGVPGSVRARAAEVRSKAGRDLLAEYRRGRRRRFSLAELRLINEAAAAETDLMAARARCQCCPVHHG